MQIIATQKVNCQDCHRCVRVCPVKAIGISQGHARVLDERCIICGKCVTDCPQQAKQVKGQVDLVQEAIAQGRKVILSIAPSFPAAFFEYVPAQLFHALVKLGFSKVEETAVGAEVVSRVYESLVNEQTESVISACCPVVVNLVKKYYPSLVHNIAPVMSPMLVHGKMIKTNYGSETFVVFAGPCIGKFAEQADNPELIDAVITFEQLKEWLIHAGIDTKCKETNKYSTTVGKARYFPLPGGILKSMSQYDNHIEFVAVDGIENCIDVLHSLAKGEINPRFVEMLACRGGCVGGPVSSSLQCVSARKVKVNEYIKGNDPVSLERLLNDNDYVCRHAPQPIVSAEPTEQEIREILERISKFTPADEKNCGACGYNSCREKAVAVYQGLAETDMCVPYMKAKAESFANIIVEHSPNAIIVVDEKMIIQDLNPAITRVFHSKISMEKGMSLTNYIDCADFIACSQKGKKIVCKRVEYPEYGVVTEQMIIPVPEHGLIIGIIDDVTEQIRSANEWEKMKQETVEKANEIITKQMHVAQEIAGLLGETTADTKSALLEMVWLLKGRERK